jgi:predicted nucleic acid-binding protein
VGTVVLDAGVVIGWMDASDAHHRAASAALVERLSHDVRLPASAWAEALVRHVQAGSVELARNVLIDAAISIDAIGEATAEEAARLRARHASLRLPDALVIAHAEVLEADELLTTDARWERVSERARFVG